jgi:putative iron-dependent peroxidase
LPATQYDVFIWLTCASYDVVFDLSRDVVADLGPQARLAHEIVGWPYHHDLDLTGFIDGTENPTLVEASEVALVGDGQPGAGGSVLLLQQWAHDVAGWEGLSVDRQEAAIGRSKADSTELDPNPATSHVSRTDQDAFGKIFRATSPTARWPSTGRSSWASARTSRSSRRCSTAWSAAAARATS